MLPNKANRFGHELRMEPIEAEDYTAKSEAHDRGSLDDWTDNDEADLRSGGGSGYEQC